MIKVEGKSNICATILADSLTRAGIRFTTYEVEVPRIVWAELMTHRMLSRGAASSRAIPFSKMVEQLNGKPVRFGQNQGGMQDKGEDYDALVAIPKYLEQALAHYLGVLHDHEGDGISQLVGITNKDGDVVVPVELAWDFHKFLSVSVASPMADAGYHKQVTGRVSEAHQMMKAVISGTEWDNFFWLRDDSAADPTIQELARVMKEARSQSEPELLMPGEWHLPYVDSVRMQNGEKVFYIVVGEGRVNLTVEEAIKVSCARCAAVSYRNSDYGLEKSLEVYERLLGDERKHASAFEHAAKVMEAAQSWNDWGHECGTNVPFNPLTWEEGISHVDREGNLWSGNLEGFIQYRKTIKGENYVAR